ncbi:MAG: FAD-dependent oxidoreductase [Candidatus Aenigmatarchaeota archaeon]
MERYDVVVLGAGPGGMGTAVYCARYNLKTLVIGKILGGMAAEAHRVENYLGFKSISGVELSQKFREHVESLGVKVVLGTDIVSVKKSKSGFEVGTADRKKYSSRSVVVALGTQKRKLELPNEEKFLGKGVSYCASCDAAFYKGKVVGVVGGSDSAGTTALMLAEHASKVYIIYRKEDLRAEPITKKRIAENRKIEIIYKTVVRELKGRERLESVILDTEGKQKELKIDGLFIEIGSVPSTVILKELGVETTEEGYIKVREDMSTNVPGIFAVGDITNACNNFKQIITAVAEGGIAANSIFRYLKGK